MTLNSREKFTLFVIGIVVVSFLIVCFKWAATPYYTAAMRKPVQQTLDLEKKIDEAQKADSDEPEHVEPNAPGIKEDQIQKHQGNRYNTF